MNRLQSFINKHYKWIILILLCLLMLKSCNGCSNERRYTYNLSQTEVLIDSLKTTIENNEYEFKHLNDSLNNEILILRSQNNILNETIKNTRKDVDHYRRVNTNLINVTENLSSQNNEK